MLHLNSRSRTILIVFAIFAFVGPNGLYLYSSIQSPELNYQALANPVALTFMIEAMMLLILFLWYVFKITASWTKVGVYFVLTFLGSLAFSFPLFLVLESKKSKVKILT